MIFRSIELKIKVEKIIRLFHIQCLCIFYTQKKKKKQQQQHDNPSIHLPTLTLNLPIAHPPYDLSFVHQTTLEKLINTPTITSNLQPPAKRPIKILNPFLNPCHKPLRE
jgi:hypothetical protein